MLVRKAGIATLLASIMMLAGGCSLGKDKASDAAAKDGSTPSAAESVDSSGDSSGVSPSDLPKAPKVKGKHGDIQALDLRKCPTGKTGKVKAKGTITSSADAVTDYLVSISWTTDSGDVMGRGDAILRDVAPGATVDWHIKATVADGATRCVTGVLYGDIK